MAVQAMIAQRLSGERLHLHEGPIDVVLRAWGDAGDVRAAEDAAIARFDGLLEELVAELPALRRDAREAPVLNGPVAQRMLRACLPFAQRGLFITGMAAVAGAVADELLAAMRRAAPGLRRVFVNDGGDIAVFLAPGETLKIGMPGEGRLSIGAQDRVGGVATSGRHGRSFSLGIADAVTVLARDAAAADAAATLIANAVDIESPAIRRAAACVLDPDSDLGDRAVTVAVGRLEPAETAQALESGAARAAAFARDGLIVTAALRLGGETRVVGVPVLRAAA